MNLKHIACAAILGFSSIATVQAADAVHDYDFNAAVQRAVADGAIDGSVKFYLAGTRSGGQVIKKGVVTNKKTNGFGKSAETSCDHVFRSAIIQLHGSAKSQGANAVTNIVSYFKSNETKSTTTYRCHKGTAVAAVALKGDLARL